MPVPNSYEASAAAISAARARRPCGAADHRQDSCIDQRAALVSGLQPGDGGQLEGGGTPRVAGRCHRRQTVDRRARIGLGHAAHDRKQHRELAKGRIEPARSGDAVIGRGGSLAVA
jgi:hypothetical protein